MTFEEFEQEWDFAHQYQLRHMAYATGTAHYHHLPAMRSMFKTLLKRLIKKMLLKKIWDYWYLSSQSEIKLNSDLKKLRKPWADPVCKKNIMISHYLRALKITMVYWLSHSVLQALAIDDIALYHAFSRSKIWRKEQHSLWLKPCLLWNEPWNV